MENILRQLAAWTVLCSVLAIAGCSDAQRSVALDGWAQHHKVEVFSGGKAVATFVSTGKVATEERTDGWYFRDAKTKKPVRVSGTVVITVLTEDEAKELLTPDKKE